MRVPVGGRVTLEGHLAGERKRETPKEEAARKEKTSWAGRSCLKL